MASPPDPAHKIHINVNFAALLGKARTSIERTAAFVACGLNGATCLSGEIPAQLPDVTMHVIYGRDTIKMSDTRPEFIAWVLQNGFRDLTETMIVFLEEVRRVAAIYKFFPTRSIAITGAEWNLLVEDQSEDRSISFNRLTLPDKLDRLRSEYGVALEADLEGMLRGLNACRNCLVHRAGVVGDKGR